MSRASTQQILRQVPVSWAVSILVLLVVYWFAPTGAQQPTRIASTFAGQFAG